MKEKEVITLLREILAEIKAVNAKVAHSTDAANLGFSSIKAAMMTYTNASKTNAGRSDEV
jgi:hypothetical protein